MCTVVLFVYFIAGDFFFFSVGKEAKGSRAGMREVGDEWDWHA